MKIWGLTSDELDRAALASSVRLVNVRPDGNATALRLKTYGPTSNGKPVKWGRVSQHIRNKDGSPRRVPGAVCWHGHRAFMREVFKINPDARIKTTLADYQGSEHFEQTHRNTRRGKRGSYYGYGFSYGQACDCQLDKRENTP